MYFSVHSINYFFREPKESEANMIVFGLFFLLINLNLVFAFQARNYLHNRITKHSNYHHFKVPCCESQNQRSFKLAFGTSDIATAFNVATFLPQPFWLLMILAPNSDLTKKLMGSWFSLLSFSLVHLFIVIVSASQEDGTAPIAEFSKVFDPAGNPLQGMLGMMTYPNFVSGIYI